MALVNKAWREGTFVPPGDEPGLVKGREFEENTQRLAVAEIARLRFALPDRMHPDLKTHTNQPEHTVGVRVGSDLLFPDIVVLNSSTTEVEMLAEVETARSLRTPDVAEKWRAFTTAGPLYLFVPLSEIDRARSLLRAAGVKLTGLRAYKMNMGQRRVEVIDVPA